MKKQKAYKNLQRLVLLFSLILLLAFKTGDYKSQYSLSRAAYSAFSTDFDLDGSNDLIVGHKTAWGDSNITVTVLMNDQHGYLATDTTLTFCGYQENIFAINLNEDSFPDIVTFYSDFTNGYAERYIRIYLSEQGYLTGFTDFNLNNSSTFSTINSGDINGNGYKDIIVVSNNSQFWGVLYNDGLGNFSEPEYHYVYNYYPTDIDCGDLNDDGRDDIVICGQKSEVYFSYPGNFQKITLETDNFKDGIILSDFDHDNDLDIVTFVDLYIVNFTKIKFYENLGDNNFDTLQTYEFQPACSNMFISDLNNDSLPDLVFHSLNQTGAYIFYNEDNFSLSESQFLDIPSYGEYSRNSYCADLDGNGYNDIITLRYLYAPLSNNLSILFNDGEGNFVEDPITQTTSNFELQTSNLTCSPNPFKSRTKIKYQLSESSFVNISVFNLNGELIKVLTHQNQDKGTHSIKWDGVENSGNPCKPGIFMVKLEINGITSSSAKIIKY